MKVFLSHSSKDKLAYCNQVAEKLIKQLGKEAVIYDESVVVMVNNLFVYYSFQVAEVHHHSVFRTAVIHYWHAFDGDAHLVRMAVNVTASAVVTHKSMSCFETKNFCKMNHYNATKNLVRKDKKKG